MHERLQKTPREELSRASMEGNVYMPRNGLNITLRTAERCLSQEDPAGAMAELIAPIPIDETLEKRTVKANAQHALHNIGKVLTPEEVRGILAMGNIGTLNLIAGLLGIKNSLPVQNQLFSKNGEWAYEPASDKVEEIVSELTPKKTELMRRLLHLAQTILDSTEVKEMMVERKTLFQDWESKDWAEKITTRKQINRLSNQIIQTIADELFLIIQDAEDTESKRMAMLFQMEMEKYSAHF